jgi:hypothetical protein
MKTLQKQLLAAGLACAFGLSAIAQTQAPQPAGRGAPEMHAHRIPMGMMDPAKRQEMRQLRMERRLAELKLRLAIAPAQEGAWNAWSTAMKPTARPQRPDRAEFERMTTPERIDRMRALRTQRQAEMDRRMDATKTFYAALNADQKKVFDGVSMRMMSRGGKGRHGGHHGHHRG